MVSSRMRIRVAVIALLTCLAAPAMAQNLACPDPLKPMLRAELLFGRNIGGRLGVSEAQWARFAAAELTPRFPDGLTVLDGKGQWRGPSGLVREPGKVVIVVTADEAGARERIAAVARAYMTRFRQKSVGVLTQPVCATFSP
jgi:hypothetical protein